MTTKIKIPDTFMGEPIKGASERYRKKQEEQERRLEEQKRRRAIPPSPPTTPLSPSPRPTAPLPITPAQSITNLENYLILSGRSHGSYSYPDLLVAMRRLSYGPEVEQAAQQLGLTLANTALTKEGHAYDYLGNINWENALKLNLALGGFTLSIRQFVNFLELLKSGKAFDGKGNKVDKRILDQILDDVLTRRDPWRVEWLDTDFKVYNSVLHINYHHELKNNQLTPKYSEPLESCLMSDKIPGIDLDYWLSHATRQGLPPQDNPAGSLRYYYPQSDNNSVAGFRAGSGRVSLSCCGGPSGSGSTLGVRHAHEK